MKPQHSEGNSHLIDIRAAWSNRPVGELNPHSLPNPLAEAFPPHGSSVETVNLIRNLPPQTKRALDSVLSETHAQLAYSDFLHLVRDLNRGGHHHLGQALAQVGLNSLNDSSSLAPAIRQNFRQQLVRESRWGEASGPWADRLEHYLSQFVDHVTDPILLASFAAGTTGFHLGRLGSLRLLRSTGPMTTGLGSLGMRATSLGVGVGAESLAFTLTQRGLHQWAHPNLRNIAQPFGQDFWATALTFGLFRAAGGLSEGLIRWHQGVPAYLPRLGRVSSGTSAGLLERTLPNASAYGALLLSQDLQMRLGWAPQASLEAMMWGSLGSLFHLKAAGHLYHRIQPRSLAQWSERVERESQWILNGPRIIQELLKPKPRHQLPWGNAMGPLFPSQWVSAGAPSSRTPRSFEEHLVFMNTEGPNRRTDPEIDLAPGGKTNPSRPVVNRELLQALEAAPWPVLILNRQGTVIQSNAHLRDLWEGQSKILEGRPFGEVMEAVSAHRGLYRLKTLLTRTGIFKLHFHSLGEGEYQVVYLKPQAGPRLIAAPEEAATAAKLRAMENLNLYLGGMLHDFNNYLFTLTSFMDMHYPQLMEAFYKTYGSGEKSATISEHGQTVRQSLSTLKGQIRTFQNLMQGLRPDRTLFTLQDVAQISLRQFQAEAQNRGLLLRFEGTPDSAMIMGNHEILSTALVNLLRNSAQASMAGQEIRIRVHAKGERAQMTIQDFGQGIAPENLSRIFEPKFTTKTRGTGLGLFMVKTIVEDLMAGKIEVESQLGEGTSTTLSFPLANPHEIHSSSHGTGRN